ncbi:hypothetical protein [Sphingobacterium haloxyli]|uniref:Uncharacterized protein n=1 Tax=Sphingobacterium haloxyli TaxID=2100533 RepID=A0A2S9IVJ0_9SPHI|nr:hypothetical protein [Sphingobacterium haloxyli]PRD44544.1 hypothetical protein C5745_19140 [Sphingobacterium haloxyli]
MKKSKQEIQIEAVKAIISGELLLEEAMRKYNVKDKRTMLAWVQKTMPLLTTIKPASNGGSNSLFNGSMEADFLQGANPDAYHQDILKENALLRKVISLQEKIRELEETNGQLVKYRNLLIEKVTSLELRIQLKDKEVR